LKKNEYTLEDLVYLMKRLRAPEDGCPWDKKQTLNSIVPHTLEEVYEVVDTIERNDIEHLKEELGDLLFQVVFYSQICDEQVQFTLGNVISDLVEKLIRRHPHVFPEGDLHAHMSISDKSDSEIAATWDQIKKTEKKKSEYILDDVPLSLPAIQRAMKIQKKVAKVGFDWDNENDVIAKVKEELEEFNQEIINQDKDKEQQEFGDLLFSLINLARWRGLDPERALRGTNNKFIRRFNYVEDQAEKELKEYTLEQMDKWWVQAKAFDR
jgi:nucleoside triphosphate diphosphatase